MKIRIAGLEVEYCAFGEGLKPLSDPPTPEEEAALAALFAEITAQGFSPRSGELSEPEDDPEGSLPGTLHRSSWSPQGALWTLGEGQGRAGRLAQNLHLRPPPRENVAGVLERAEGFLSGCRRGSVEENEGVPHGPKCPEGHYPGRR